MPAIFDTLALPTDRSGRLLLIHPVTRAPLLDEAGEQGWIELYSWESEQAQGGGAAAYRRQLARAHAAVLRRRPKTRAAGADRSHHSDDPRWGGDPLARSPPS